MNLPKAKARVEELEAKHPDKPWVQVGFLRSAYIEAVALADRLQEKIEKLEAEKSVLEIEIDEMECHE